MSDEEMTALLAVVERDLGSAWGEVVTYMRDSNQLDDLVAAVETHDTTAILETVQEAAEHFAAATDAAFREAAARVAVSLDAVVPDKLIRFDQTNHGAVRWAEQNQTRLVGEFTREQRETIQQVLIEGARSGENPTVIARDLRASLGLTPQQEKWVSGYRDLLESQDYAGALSRELSHGWSDKTIAAAARREVAMTPESIDLAVERYRANVIAYRAEVIARTEGLRVTHQGADEAIQQAIDRGDIKADALTREWSTAHDGHVRSSHRYMQGQQRRVGEAFETGNGATLRYPGDPAAPVAEVAQCRCVVATHYASQPARKSPRRWHGGHRETWPRSSASPR